LPVLDGLSAYVGDEVLGYVNKNTWGLVPEWLIIMILQFFPAMLTQTYIRSISMAFLYLWMHPFL